MTLSDEILQEIEDLAGLFLAPDEIAVLLDLDIEQFKYDIKNKRGEAYKRYFLGVTKSKKLIHENIVSLAKRGSSQAEEIVQKMISEQSMKERNAR